MVRTSPNQKDDLSGGDVKINLIHGENMHCFVLALKNYAQFTGRAQRSEYWCFYLLLIALYRSEKPLQIESNLTGSAVFFLLPRGRFRPAPKS